MRPETDNRVRESSSEHCIALMHTPCRAAVDPATAVGQETAGSPQTGAIAREKVFACTMAPPAATCSAAPDQAAIRAALKDAESRAHEGCRAPAAGKNTGTVTIAIAPSGQVSATIDGALGQSEGGRCLTNFLTSARVACFTGEPVKLRKSITLE